MRAELRDRQARFQLDEQAISAQSAVAMLTNRVTAEIAAELTMLCHGRNGDTAMQAALSAGVMAEVLLLLASGLFDHGFYQRQLDEPLTLAAALCHYVLVGEAEGLLANPLFDREYYISQVQAAGAPGLDRFNTRLAHYGAVGSRLGLSPDALVDREFCLAQIDRAEQPGFEPVSYYTQVGRFIGFVTHPLISKAHYLRMCGGLAVDEDPLADYRLDGYRRALSLHPLFDAEWYLEQNVDVRAAGCDPLRHYLTFGDAEGRWPNPLFDPTYYRLHASPPVPDGRPALTHYVLHGRRGARTHMLFDGAWYRKENADVGLTEIDPLEHYLGSGSGEHRSPHPLFDTKYLLAHYPALLRHHRTPLVAFLRSRARDAGSPHPLFDPAHYLTQVPEAAESPDGIFAHFVRHGAENGADPHPLFCTRYYVEQMAQATEGLPQDPGNGTALAHFLTTDFDRGFKPHPLFDPRFYLDNNGDVRTNGINPLVHFMMSGGTSREGRQPHLLFDIGLYAERLGARSADIVGDDANLLLDFMLNWRQRPAPHALFDPVHYASQNADTLFHENPLADYAWKGRAARRTPHPLFDNDFYLACVDIPANWQRTLVEHYAVKLAPEGFLPHPALDGQYVAALIGEDSATNRTLLEDFVIRSADRDLSPHIRFASRDYVLLHPKIEDCSGDAIADPFTMYLRHGGRPEWVPANKRMALETFEAEKIALCGVGGVAPVNPLLARGRASRHRATVREIVGEPVEIVGALPRPDRAGGKLAIYAASANPAAEALHDHAMSELAKAGFTILAVEGAIGASASRPMGKPASRHAAATLRHRMGHQQIGAWVMACRHFGDAIASYGQVLFLSDNLVGPIGSTEAFFESLTAGTTGWWGITDADQSGGAVDTDCFALSGEAIASPAFQSFIADFEFGDSMMRVTEVAEHEMARALRASGYSPTLLADASAARLSWLQGLPAKLRWFRDLAVADAATPTSALSARIAAYAEPWLRARIQNPNFGGRIRPALLFWDALLQDHQCPFLRRDLLVANPINDPSLLRLRDILGAEDLALLHRLVGPTLPAPESLPHPPVLRLGRQAATEFTRVIVPPPTDLDGSLNARAQHALPFAAEAEMPTSFL